MIKNVKIKKIIIHKDKRGFFAEVIRQSDSFFADKFAQLSHARVNKGVIKAWHLHKKQTDWIYVAVGRIKLVLYDLRKSSATYQELTEIMMGGRFDRQAVRIPPGVGHGFKVIAGPAHVIYLMNRVYDPQDEIRISAWDPKIGYDWKKLKKSDS